MDSTLQPTFGNGKICYLEIPALDIPRSAAFYQNVFGWRIRTDHDGNLSFDDAVGQVSGTWVTGREPANKPGLMVSIMVYALPETLKTIVENSGMVLNDPKYAKSGKIAFFSNPAGNVFCLYEHTNKDPS
jgi:uncharacterized protein